MGGGTGGGPGGGLGATSSLALAQVLDTADVSQKIREILSSHNIGQRLFAKHVLGLSQGTVSELLSKPKHWDKLTEKGRESYRKMYSWAIDESNVTALKAISPKKGRFYRTQMIVNILYISIIKHVHVELKLRRHPFRI